MWSRRSPAAPGARKPDPEPRLAAAQCLRLDRLSAQRESARRRAQLHAARRHGGRYRRGRQQQLHRGLSASYQVGLFGEVRRTVEATRATYEGAGFSYAATLLTVESELARNYMLARAYQAQLANARASLGLQDDNLEIAGFRVQAGLVSSLDAEQARGQRAQTAATIPSIEQQYNAAVSRLGVLTGQAPARSRRGSRRSGRSRPAPPSSAPAFPPISCAAAPMSARPSAIWPPPPRGSAWRRRRFIRRLPFPGTSTRRRPASVRWAMRSPAACLRA